MPRLRLQRVLTLLWILSIALAPSGTAHLPASAERAAETVNVEELRQHVQRLAADDMGGRGIGQPGNRRAELYISNALQRAGVTPASAGSFLQPVQVYQPVLGAGARLVVTSGGTRMLDVGAGRDFYPLRISNNVSAAGPLVFAGHGITMPRFRHDDYAEIDARGAVALVLDGVPAGLARAVGMADESGLDLSDVAAKSRNAAAHGAIGLIVIRPSLADKSEEWPERSTSRSAAYRLYSDLQKDKLPVAALSETAAAPLRHALHTGTATATLIPDVVVQPFTLDNVIGYLEGREPSHRDMIVIGAHLDHDGIEEDGQVYNGADDNASGTSAVLAIAAAFARAAAQGERPARAVVFALWNAEEKGSLGAQAYVEAPQPARRIAGNINLDMVGRDEEVPDPGDPRYQGLPRTTAAENTNVVHLLGYTYSPDLARLVVSANDSIRLTIKQDYDRNAQNLLQRSDQWVFLQRGIPAVFLTTGLHPDYHTPTDDTERLNFSKLERIAKLAFRAAWAAADSPAPRFRPAKQHG